MKKTLFYEYICHFVPSIQDQKADPVKNRMYTCLFVITNGMKDIDEDFSLRINFNSNSKIIDAWVTDGIPRGTNNGNNYCVKIDRLKKEQLFKIHFKFTTSCYDHELKVETDNPGIELTSSPKCILNHHRQVQPLKIKNDFLIVSALQEELKPLTKIMNWEYFDEEKIAKRTKLVNSRGHIYNAVMYSINKMGMPFNGVAITKKIESYSPKYLIFLGTCAGLRRTRNLSEGDVLIPEYIYAYDSGKHNSSGKFEVEHRHYDLSSKLISILNDMRNKNRKYRFNVEVSCGFCSGASVVSSREMREKIVNDANRKVLGFDMEAYIIAIINQLYPDIDTIVVKGIMDFGVKKTDKFKEKAKNHSVKIAMDLIKYIIENERWSAIKN